MRSVGCWVKTHAYDPGITTKRTQDLLRISDAIIDLHVHLSAGARKKNGQSAGVTMVRGPFFLNGFGAKMTVMGLVLVQVCAIVSLLTGKYVPPTTATTGEVCKEYDLFFCSREDMSVVHLQIATSCSTSFRFAHGWITLLVPEPCAPNFFSLISPTGDTRPRSMKEARARIQFAFARTVEVLDAAFGPGSLPCRTPDAHHPLVRSRLYKMAGRVVKEREKERVLLYVF